MKYDNSNFSGKENVTRRNILENVISLKVNKYFLYEARHIILILKPWSSHVPNAIKNLVHWKSEIVIWKPCMSICAKENVRLVGRKLIEKIITNDTYGLVKIRQSVRTAKNISNYLLNADYIYRETTKTNFLNVKIAERSF